MGELAAQAVIRKGIILMTGLTAKSISRYWGVFLPEQENGSSPLTRRRLWVILGQQFRRPGYQDVPEPVPVRFIVVHHQGRLRIVQDVADAAKPGEGSALGLLVEDGVDGMAG